MSRAIATPTPRPASRSERLALLAALLLAAGLMLPLRGYLTDDTFIHLQFARHLAGGQGPVFNPGERVYGCTSPLWMTLIALGMRLGADGLLVAKLLGAIATLASVVLFSRLLRQTVEDPAWRAAGTLAWAGHAWMLRWSLSGMETPLAVSLILAGFVAFTASEPWGARRALTGAAWALAALARPEAGLLLLLWGAAVVADGEVRASARRLGAAFLPAALIAGSWLLFAGFYYGTIVPRTLSAKAAGGTGIEVRLENARRLVGIVGATDGILIAILVVALIAAVRRGRPARVPVARLLPWAWLLAVPALYLARGVPMLSRYLTPLLPVLAWLAWRAAARWRRAPGIAALVAVLVLVENLAVYRSAVVPQVASFTRGMRESLIPFGLWLDMHAPPGATIATPDIGAIGYYSRRRVLDLGGLVTPRMIPLLEGAPFEEVLARLGFADFARPEFVLDRGPQAGDLLRRSPHAPALTPLASAAVPNLGIARPGRVVYTLYRVDWSRVKWAGNGP